MNNPEIYNRLIKARTELQIYQPFFSYLLLFIKLSEAKEGQLGENAGGGINMRGDLVYNPKWVSKLDHYEIKGFLAHEILHLALLHLTRSTGKNHNKWNVATDLVINAMLKNMESKRRSEQNPTLQEKILLPKMGLIPNQDDCFTVNDVKIREISKKCAEEVYDLIPDQPQGGSGSGEMGDSEGESGDSMSLDSADDKRFDQHGFGGKDGKEISQTEKEVIEREWLNRFQDALLKAQQQRGTVPAGLERYFNELKRHQLPWGILLRKYVTSYIPNDQTWMKRGKKSFATGIYLPSVVQDDKIDIVIGIDLSGSIKEKELNEFVSEIVGIAKEYPNRVNMRVLSFDCEVHTDNKVENGGIEQIKKIQLKGGGGTSFLCVKEYIKEKNIRPKVLIMQTDGEGDEMYKTEYPIIWCLSKNGTDSLIKERKGDVILRLQ